MELTDLDERIAQHMRNHSVLQDIDDYLLDASEGLILGSCADGDLFHDIFNRKIEVVMHHRDNPRIHTFGWNGGALRLARLPTPTGRIIRLMANVVFMRFGIELIDPFQEIAAARRMKKINTVALVAHAPCGYAAAQSWDLLKVMRQLIRAKDNLKTLVPGVKVKLYPHIHWPDGRNCSYFTSREGWRQYETFLSEHEHEFYEAA